MLKKNPFIYVSYLLPKVRSPNICILPLTQALREIGEKFLFLLMFYTSTSKMNQDPHKGSDSSEGAKWKRQIDLDQKLPHIH